MIVSDYVVRVSARARHPRLKVSARDGLIVVIPADFDPTRVPSIIDRKRDWIRRSQARLRGQQRFLQRPQPFTRPERIQLRAIGQEWSVSYRETAAANVTAGERQGQRLLIYGCLDSEPAVISALRRWLGRTAKEELAPWLGALATERSLDVRQVAIRSQRTRWASCSATGTISLNLRLLFLPPDLARYALLHELAHLVEMNHSPRYWATLASFEPNFAELDQQLRTGWRFVPDWLRPT